MSLLNNYHNAKHFLQTTHLAGFDDDFKPFLYMKNHGSAAIEVSNVLNEMLATYPNSNQAKSLLKAGAGKLTAEQAENAAKDASNYKFAIIRDPAERLVSTYLRIIESDSKPRQALYKILNLDDKKSMDLSEFIKTLANNPEAFDLNRHWRPQRTEISYDQIKYDFIGLTNNYVSSITHICNAIFNKEPISGLPADLYKNDHRLHSLLSDLSPQDYDYIKNMYKQDYEMLEEVQKTFVPTHVIATALDDSADKDVWRNTLAEIGKSEGFFEELGPKHSALFINQGKTLIVTFENLDHVHGSGGDRMPWGFDFVKKQGWSMLGMMAHDWTWYRDEAVFDFFDRLRDEGFYDQFDNVVFYGASMGGYAASVFSASCPGAKVILISPQATIDPKVVPWEYRYPKANHQPFNGRYSYGPDMIKSAGKAYLFIDPHQKIDRQHADLFDPNDVEIFHSFYCGHRIASLWQQFKILKWVVMECVEGTITKKSFYHKLRLRRDNRRYRIEMVERLQKKERWGLLVIYCQGILNQQKAPVFRKYMIDAQKHLNANKGKS